MRRLQGARGNCHGWVIVWASGVWCLPWQLRHARRAFLFLVSETPVDTRRSTDGCVSTDDDDSVQNYSFLSLLALPASLRFPVVYGDLSFIYRVADVPV